MRVTNKAMYDGIVQNLGTTSEEMIKAHKVVSSGKKIGAGRHSGFDFSPYRSTFCFYDGFHL